MTVIQGVRSSLRLLDRRDRPKLLLLVIAQMATALLDLLGVALVGLIGALSVAIVDGSAAPLGLTEGLARVGLGSVPQTSVITVFACVAAGALLAKSVISPLLMARVLRFLAAREVAVSADLTRELLCRPLTFVQQRSSQDTAAAVVQATTAATTVILGQTAIAASELALLAAFAVALLGIKPWLAAIVIAYFGIIGFALQGVLGHRGSKLEAQRVRGDVASLRAVQEAIGTYREVTVSDRRLFFADRVKLVRGAAAQASANQQLIALLPKYISEAAMVAGALAMATWLFKTESVDAATGTFAFFLAAAARILPSLLRLQSATLTIRKATGSASRTFSLADDLDRTARRGAAGRESRVAPRGAYPDFRPVIELGDVVFTYPGSGRPAVRGISLEVGLGTSVALVGRSGAGKSTLADLILGVLDPDTGVVRVGGVPPAEAIRRWPGAIGYVPQDVMLTNDSIRRNVALGLPDGLIDDELVWDALRRAQFAAYVLGLSDGLDSQVGERGLRLSGGQRQRLGLARALYSRPRLLVLDEATSALDAETEQTIAEMLSAMEAEVTKVVIAHRLSTVRHSDLVVYLEAGEVAAAGAFDQVCERVPALQRQADLIGLR